MAKMKNANRLTEMVWALFHRYKNDDPEMSFFESRYDAEQAALALEWPNSLAYAFVCRVEQQLADKQDGDK